MHQHTLGAIYRNAANTSSSSGCSSSMSAEGKGMRDHVRQVQLVSSSRRYPISQVDVASSVRLMAFPLLLPAGPKLKRST